MSIVDREKHDQNFKTTLIDIMNTYFPLARRRASGSDIEYVYNDTTLYGHIATRKISITGSNNKELKSGYLYWAAKALEQFEMRFRQVEPSSYSKREWSSNATLVHCRAMAEYIGLSDTKMEEAQSFIYTLLDRINAMEKMCKDQKQTTDELRDEVYVLRSMMLDNEDIDPIMRDQLRHSDNIQVHKRKVEKEGPTFDMADMLDYEMDDSVVEKENEKD